MTRGGVGPRPSPRSLCGSSGYTPTFDTLAPKHKTKRAVHNSQPRERADGRLSGMSTAGSRLCLDYQPPQGMETHPVCSRPALPSELAAAAIVFSCARSHGSQWVKLISGGFCDSRVVASVTTCDVFVGSVGDTNGRRIKKKKKTSPSLSSGVLCKSATSCPAH